MLLRIRLADGLPLAVLDPLALEGARRCLADGLLEAGPFDAGRAVLTLRGRLRGAGPSAAGALVQIQAVVNGRWAPVGRARTGRDGAYRWRYRFVHLSRDTTFRFRPVVERVPGWPWPTVRGPAMAVRVDVP